jgi:hypothetical protein
MIATLEIPAEFTRFQVKWRMKPTQPWQSAEFREHAAALSCFFRWLQRGVDVQWQVQPLMYQETPLSPRGEET